MLDDKFAFRPAKALKDFAFTMVFCAFIALFVTAINISESLGTAFVMSYSIGICIHLLIVGALFLIKPTRKIAIWAAVISGAVLGNAVGMRMGAFLSETFMGEPVGFLNPVFIQIATLGISFGAAISFFFWSRSSLQATQAQVQEEKIKRISSEKAAVEANLRLLQAQIEPHFLFNTLSNIYSLMDSDLETAKAMLLDLNQYLRHTLRQTRKEQTTLGREMEVVAAYLKIFKIRMGDRLQVDLDLPASLKAKPFPTMLLQPLVENAVIHGIEPSENGGSLKISARRQGASLQVEITDTGIGFKTYTVNGVGIANVKERLGLLFGEGGRLRLQENQPCGVTAVIEIPDEHTR